MDPLAAGRARGLRQDPASGRIKLENEMLGALAKQPPGDVARLLVDEKIEFLVKIGPLEGTDRLQMRRIPVDWWRMWLASYAKALAPEDQLHWEACRDALAGDLEALKCSERSSQTPDGFVRLGTRDLQKTPRGDYAYVAEVPAAAGAKIVLRTVLPSENADWLFMVIDLESMTVLAEQFSGKAARQDVTVVAPRTSTYAIVANSEKPGRFTGHLVVTEKAK